MVQPAATLTLRRDPETVSTARRVLERTLDGAAVVAEDVADLSVAVSEACSNAVRHADGSPTYAVEIHLEADRCTVRVSDAGPGFVPQGVDMPPPESQDGRGLALMRVMVDSCRLVITPGRGTTIVLDKVVGLRSHSSRVDPDEDPGTAGGSPDDEEAHDGREG